MEPSISSASAVRLAHGTELAAQLSGVRAQPAGRGSSTPQGEGADRARRPSAEELGRLVEELNLRIPEGRGIRFQVSGEGDELVVQVVDRGSDEVVRTIPPDRLSGLRRHFHELTGAILDDLA